MDKRKSIFVTFVVVVLLFAAAHSFYYFYGQGIGGLGISGAAVDDTPTDGVSLSPGSSLSRLVLFIEWEVIVLLFVFVLLRRKTLTKKELQDLMILKQQIKSEGVATDIDNLHQLLKQRGKVRLSTVAGLYNIKKDIAMGWGKTLESGHLVTIDYPRFGEPEFVLVGKPVEENTKSKK